MKNDEVMDYDLCFKRGVLRVPWLIRSTTDRLVSASVCRLINLDKKLLAFYTSMNVCNRIESSA